MKLRNFVIITAIVLCSSLKAYSQTANITEGCAPLEVDFTAPGSSTTYYWDFKDGVTSNLENPTNIFSTAGTYNVEFKETPSGPVIATIPIVVHPVPELNISAANQISCPPHNVTFQNASVVDPSITVQSVNWVFGDGEGAIGTENPSHAFPGTGTYDISITVQTNFSTCTKTVLFEDFIETINGPTASFTTNPSSTFSCESPLTVDFNENSSGERDLTYDWTFGNGNTSDERSPDEQTYTDGQYTARLQVGYEGISGCQAFTSRGISVGSPEPEIIGDDSVCLDDFFQVSSSIAGVYNWDFGADAIVSGGSTMSPSVKYSTPGLKTVRLTVSNSGCSGTVEKEIFVDQIEVSLVSTPGYICENPATIAYEATSNREDVIHTWNITRVEFKREGLLINIGIELPDPFNPQPKPINIYEIPAYTTYEQNVKQIINARVTVTSLSSGCEAFVDEVDTVWIPDALPMPDITKGCIPLEVTFSDSSTFDPDKPLTNWEWDFGDGNKENRNASSAVSHTYTTPGIYDAKLTVTNSVGCKDTSYAVQIEVGDEITSGLDFVASKSEVCPGEEVTFENTSTSSLVDGIHFNVEDDRSSHCPFEDDYAWTFEYGTGPQDVSMVAEYNGCFTTFTKPGIVNVKGAVAKIDYNFDCDSPLEYNFESKSSGATDLLWDFGDTQTDNGSNPVHTFATADNYTVTLTASDPSSGCAADEATVLVNVRQVESIMALDSHICIDVDYELDATPSVDVDNSCYRGYSWIFPTLTDERQHTVGTPKHTFIFTEAGNHTVKLAVEDMHGCTDTSSFDLKVFDMEVAATVDDDEICFPTTVQFTNNTTSDTTITQWNWTFGDGNSSTLEAPDHNYQNSTNFSQYFVELKATDILGCSETFPVTINRYFPKGTINATDFTICEGTTIQISSDDYTSKGSNLTFDWDFGNGQTSLDQSSQVTFNTEGTYDITLNTVETATGCPETVYSTIYVQSFPQAGIQTNVTDSDVLCAPQNMFFEDASTATSLLTYYWDFDNGLIRNTEDVSLLFQKGTFNVQHVVSTTYGCRDTVYKEYKVFRPEGDFEVDRNTICKSESITFEMTDTADVYSFTWAFGDGNTVNDIAPVTHPYYFHPESGQTIAKLIIRGEDDICPVEIQKPIFIHQVIAEFLRKDGIDTTLCISEGSFPFTNQSVAANEYQWDFGDGTISDELNPNHTFPGPGFYDVQLTILNNETSCRDTITKVAAVFENPTVEVLDDTICQGETTTLSVLNPNIHYTYDWSPSTGLSVNNGTTVTANPTETVLYTVTATDTTGCDATDNPELIVIGPINIYDWDTTIVIGDKAVLPVLGPDVYNFQWTPEEGLSCLTCNQPYVRPLEDISYALEVTDIKNCFTSNAQYDITVKPETFVKLPTTFTPNLDGVNDELFVEGWGIKQLLEFKIFNRWGQLVYESTDIEQGWDGSFKGQPQRSDVYVYQVKVLTWRDEEIFEEGYINLLH